MQCALCVYCLCVLCPLYNVCLYALCTASRPIRRSVESLKCWTSKKTFINLQFNHIFQSKLRTNQRSQRPVKFSLHLVIRRSHMVAWNMFPYFTCVWSVVHCDRKPTKHSLSDDGKYERIYSILCTVSVSELTHTTCHFVRIFSALRLYHVSTFLHTLNCNFSSFAVTPFSIRKQIRAAHWMQKLNATAETV